jgi:hypothetical protein
VPRPLEAEYPHEMRRWILYFGSPLLGACICIALAFATPYPWLFGGAILLGPGVSIGVIVYLALSTDTNGGAARHASTSSHHAAVPASLVAG